MQLTPAQARAVTHRGSSLLVAASAGSGKTEVLAQRCVGLIADPRQPCEIDGLLVVTFTRAAAAELRVRIARELRRAATTAAGTGMRDHLRKQAVLVDAAEIGTIDGWCNRLVRANCAAAEVDPAFAILSEQDAELLRSEQLDALFDWLYRSDDPPAAEARAWLRRNQTASDEFLRNLVEGLHRFREHLVLPEQWFARLQASCAATPETQRVEAQRILAASLRDECAFQLAGLDALLPRVSTPAARVKLHEHRENLADWTARLTDPQQLAAVVEQIAVTAPRKPSKLPAEDAAAFEMVIGRWLKKRLKERWPPDVVAGMLDHAPDTAALLRTLLTLEARYHDALLKAKASRAALEFGDVLRLALRALGTPQDDGTLRPTGVALELQERYKHILVDEYQDTSPVQAALLGLVTRTTPGRTNRFMVGDVKQSIYGFRQADARLFTRQQQEFEQSGAAGRVEFLSDNFRSHARLLAALNPLFAALFDPQLGGTAFDERERLTAGREQQELPNPTLDHAARCEVHLLKQTGRGEPAEGDEGDEADAADTGDLTGVEREATQAAQRIRALLAAGTLIPERVKGSAGAGERTAAGGTAEAAVPHACGPAAPGWHACGPAAPGWHACGPAAPGWVEPERTALRPLRLSDIVVLLRAAARNAGLVARVFRQAGIACITAGRETLLDALEVQDVLNVLRLLVNRRQDLPMAAYLRGPLVELGEPALLAIRRHAPPPSSQGGGRGRDAPFYEAVAAYRSTGLDAALVARLRSAEERLLSWETAARHLDVPALLRRIIHDGGLAAFAAALPGGPQRVGFLDVLVQYARDFAAAGGAGLAEFLEHVEALTAEQIDPGAPVAAGSDVVRIMTIHAAKGLEFPVVFLLNAGARFNYDSQKRSLQCDEERGAGLRFFDYPARTELRSAAHFAAAQAVGRRELDESLRLLYVALTRARDLLVIMGHAAEARWNEVQTLFADRPVPLAARVSGGNLLDWVLYGVASAGLSAPRNGAPPLVSVTRHGGDLAAPGGGADGSADLSTATASEAPAAPVAPLDTADRAWLAAAQQWLATPVFAPLAQVPAGMSVSALKELAMRDAELDRPLVLDEPYADAPPTRGHAAPALAVPAFAGIDAEPEGRVRGTACHAFLQHADLRRLDDAAAIAQQVAQLVADGRLEAAQAALLPAADLVWLGQSEIGRLLAQHAAACRREFPFVRAETLGRAGSARQVGEAGAAQRVDPRDVSADVVRRAEPALPGSAAERVIVRGIIDCLIDTPDGLVVLDYKTDRVSDDAMLRERVAGYSVQLQAYARAAAALLGRPVQRAVLVFLNIRQVVEVRVGNAE